MFPLKSELKQHFKDQNILFTINFVELWGEIFQFQDKKNKIKPLGRNGLIFEPANEISTGSQILEIILKTIFLKVCDSKELG